MGLSEIRHITSAGQRQRPNTRVLFNILFPVPDLAVSLTHA
jgi:hypothetical protein